MSMAIPRPLGNGCRQIEGTTVGKGDGLRRDGNVDVYSDGEYYYVEEFKVMGWAAETRYG